MRAALYARVSKDEQQRGRSVGQQEETERTLSARNDWTIVGVFIDNDLSASRYARKPRPDFAELLKLLDAGGCDVLVLWESNRGSRRLSEWAQMLDTCYDRGILIHVAVQGRTLDPRNARDMKSLQEDGVDAEYESAKTRDRIMRDIKAAADEGRPHGRLAYGYQREYAPGKNGPVFLRQIEVPEQAEILREMARRVLEGESCYAIAKDLNERRVPTAAANARWEGERVKRLLINPVYAGLRVLNGTVTGKGMWDPIIDPDDHERLRARLLDPKRRTVRDPNVRHFLTGACRCGVCESRMRVQKNRGHLAYVCAMRPPGSNHDTPKTTVHVSIKVDWIEPFVAKMVAERLRRGDVESLFVPVGNADTVTVAKAELANLQRQLDETADEVVAGRMSPTLAAKIEAGLLPKVEDAKRRAVPAVISPARAALTASGVNPVKVWEKMNPAQQREFITDVAVVVVGRIESRKNPREFNPWRLAGSRWINDTRTWGEHWTEAGL